MIRGRRTPRRGSRAGAVAAGDELDRSARSRRRRASQRERPRDDREAASGDPGCWRAWTPAAAPRAVAAPLAARRPCAVRRRPAVPSACVPHVRFPLRQWTALADSPARERGDTTRSPRLSGPSSTAAGREATHGPVRSLHAGGHACGRCSSMCRRLEQSTAPTSRTADERAGSSGAGLLALRILRCAGAVAALTGAGFAALVVDPRTRRRRRRRHAAAGSRRTSTDRDPDPRLPGPAGERRCGAVLGVRRRRPRPALPALVGRRLHPRGRRRTRSTSTAGSPAPRSAAGTPSCPSAAPPTPSSPIGLHRRGPRSPRRTAGRRRATTLDTDRPRHRGRAASPTRRSRRDAPRRSRGPGPPQAATGGARRVADPPGRRPTGLPATRSRC